MKGSHRPNTSPVVVTLCPTRMIAAGLVLCARRRLLPPSQATASACVCVSERMLPLLSSPLSHVEKRRGEGAREGAIKRRFFVTGNVHAGAPHRTSLSLPPFFSCLHARVLQSWNGKFLAAFGVKFARVRQRTPTYSYSSMDWHPSLLLGT